MTIKELMAELDPNHTEADGQIVTDNVASPWDRVVFDVDAVVTGPVRTGNHDRDRTWTVEDSSGRYLVTETGNGDVSVDEANAIAQAEGE